MEFEVKYKIDQRNILDIEYWLDRVLIPDPAYPDSIVSSIYFDSYALKSYREKLDGDYLKTKYRIRWYETPDLAQSTNFITVAQIKRKYGNLRMKESLSINPLCLHNNVIDSKKIADCQTHFNTMEYPPEEALFPIALIRYRRKRYLDQISGLRVCIDYDIEAPCFSAHISSPRTVQLYNGVLELKGASEELPQILQPILRMGCRKTAYSKYSSCLQKLTQDDF